MEDYNKRISQYRDDAEKVKQSFGAAEFTSFLESRSPQLQKFSLKYIIDTIQQSESHHKLWMILAKAQAYREAGFLSENKGLVTYQKYIPEVEQSLRETVEAACSCISICMKFGAALEAPDALGKTPLISSLRLRNDAITLRLLEHGANPNHNVTIPALPPFEYKLVTSPLVEAASVHYTSFRSIDAILDYGGDPNFISYYISKDHKKIIGNKAINWIIYKYIINFEFQNEDDSREHARVKDKLISSTKNAYFEIIKNFLRGGVGIKIGQLR
ncbi:hypothetical protein OAH86_02100 [Planktomarina temperata]|nr:hypothetical protein [Planktomarina temperata]